jgi:hypothetical protein
VAGGDLARDKSTAAAMLNLDMTAVAAIFGHQVTVQPAA